MNIEQFGKVAVLYGGKSSEREVSLNSGKAVYEGLIRKGVDAHLIDVRENFIQKMEEGKFDRAFIVLHGRGGEDGTIQGTLEFLGIPYTGSKVAASALTMDKVRTKWLWQNLHLSTLPFFYFSHTDFIDEDEVIKKFGLPLAVKPSREGSSYGVSCVLEKSQFKSATKKAFQYDTQIVIEPWIKGREFTAAILNGKVLPLIEIRPSVEYYDYAAKYERDDTQFLCPAPLEKEKENSMMDLAQKAFSSTDCYGWGRIDFLSDEKGNIWLTEVNTVPGMTSHSLVPLAAKTAGMNFDELVLEILKTSLNE